MALTADPEQLQYLVFFGPNENCTLALCDPAYSIYGYRPSLASNVVIMVFFLIAMLLHIGVGVFYRQWFFMTAMVLGCIAEIIGYGGRIALWQNPFSFNGFLTQIICITIAPVFFSAAIYVTLTRLTKHLEPSLCWYPPQLYYWLFIPFDIISLALQAAGGGLSTDSTGTNDTGVDISLAGLCFQVATLVIFIAFCVDYAIRYTKFRKAQTVKQPLPTRLKVFVIFLSLSIILIFIRCIYRIDELSQGYASSTFREQGLFYGLETAMIVAATYTLLLGHPGPTLSEKATNKNMAAALDPEKARGAERGSDSDTSSPVLST